MNRKSKEITGKVTDIVLIGAGIMSATLGVLLKELDPNLSIEVYERLDVAAAESSDAWNNAGTGHSAFCELNYTPQQANGTVDIKKAIAIAESYEVSKQFWTYLVQKGVLPEPSAFIRHIPHLSFVWGENNVNFLKTRYNNLTNCNLFSDMQYSENVEEVKKWMPLVMDGRDPSAPVAATKMDLGTDVNFGSLTKEMFNYLAKQDNVTIHFHHEIRDLDKQDNGNWELKVKDLYSGEKQNHAAKFVFIGAGGGSLLLLEKSDIKEGKGFGGFPVSGQWLKCTNEEVIARHHGKVYGKAAVGAPPMSVPHLDTRMINGKQALLFGPYAGFSTKFLKNGSYFDLASSIHISNIRPMISAGLKSLDLTKYLIEQVRQSPEDRLEALKEYVPSAKIEDWELAWAGQRVQVIKKKPSGGGILEFGTEVVSAEDGSIAALLGASPGASTAVSIMLDLLDRCFKKQMETVEWQDRIKDMIPTFGHKLADDNALCLATRKRTSAALKLNEVSV